VYGGKDGVGIDSGATTASVGGEVTTGGVFVGLERSISEIEGWVWEMHTCRKHKRLSA
jgi:hypothetical protein